jgi:hypothetical protein
VRDRAGSFAARLALIACGAFVVRAAAVLLISRKVTGLGDFFFFHWQAGYIADGRGFIDPWQLKLHGDLWPSAGHPPLWSLVLAGASKLGLGTITWHKLVGCVLGAGVVGLVGLGGRELGGRRLGLAAAGVAAVYPLFIAADGSMMSETLYGLWIAAAVLLALRLRRRPAVATAAGLGAAVALAALTRSEGLGLLILLGVPACVAAARGLRLRLAAACVLAALLVLTPWTVRNLHVFHRFVLVSTNDATVLAGANCPRTYYGKDIGSWRIECVAGRTKANEAAQAAIWRRQGLDYAGDHLGRLAVVVPVRVLRAFDFYQPRRQVLFAEARQIRIEQAGIATYYVLLALAIGGAVVLRRRRPDGFLVLLAPVALVVLAAAAGYGITKVRHAAEIPIVLLASVALLELADRWTARRALTGRARVAAGYPE